MTLTLDLTNQESQDLTTLAKHCGVSPQEMAQIFLKDGIRSFINEQNELRDSITGNDTQP